MAHGRRVNKFTGCERPLTGGDIDDVERRFGVVFPASLRQHYLRWNGGAPERYLFVDEEGVTFVVNDFLPIKYAHPQNLSMEELIQDWQVEQAIIGREFIPFAADPGGNWYCMKTTEPDRGAVFFFDHEFGHGGESLRRLVASFNEFLQQMRESRD